MKLLITEGSKEVTQILKGGLNQFDVTVRKEASDDSISQFDCAIIQALSEKCKTPQDLNLKLQEVYNNLSAFVEGGIKKVIMISSLSVLQNYKKSFTVTEKWKSTPSTDIDLLTIHLSEIIFKEFGRTFPSQRILLRSGFPFIKANEQLESFSSRISHKVFTKSVEQIIKTEFNERYEIIHVQERVADQQFLTNKYNRIESLGGIQEQAFYEPRLNRRLEK